MMSVVCVVCVICVMSVVCVICVMSEICAHCHHLVFSMQDAIANAKSLEEVQQLEAMLKAGQIPGGKKPATNGQHQGIEEEEEEMEASNGPV